MKDIFVYGTTAELLKIAPVVALLEKDSFELWSSQQQPEDLERLEFALGIRPDKFLRKGTPKPLVSTWQIPQWSAEVFSSMCKLLRRQSTHYVIVHGDTITSLVAGVAAKLNGRLVAHIEAGLRSGSIRHPFPEEIVRRITSSYADVNFAPTQTAMENLNKVRGRVFHTHGNTIEDALAQVTPVEPVVVEGLHAFGLVSLHRKELLSNGQVLKSTLQELRCVASTHPLVVILDNLTQSSLKSWRLLSLLEHPNIRKTTKLGHAEFQWVLRNASFLITDSGGQQEESAKLGIPTLIHRRFTERSEGLEKNIRLSGWVEGSLVSFVHEALQSDRSPAVPNSQISPSQVIATFLSEKR